MKTIGIIGGMSWESTALYYRLINEQAKAMLGGFHSAKVIVFSVDFDDVKTSQNRGDWAELSRMMVNAAHSLKAGGADILMIAANSMHKVADEVEAQIDLKFIHIADSVADSVDKLGLQKVLLLGTRFTMEDGFYIDRLAQTCRAEVVIPNELQRQMIHDMIMEELVLGDFFDSSREMLVNLIDAYEAKGVQGVILGCTELPLLLRQSDVNLPLFDSVKLHVRYGIVKSLA